MAYHPTLDRAQQRAAVEQARKSKDLPAGRALLAELEAELLRWDAAELARACSDQTPAQIVSCQLEVRSKHSSNDPAAAASPMSASQRSVTNRNRKVYESRVPTWKREDRENLNLQRASLVLIDLLERADDGLPLLLLPALLQDSLRELEVTTGGQQLVMHADAHGIRIVGPMLQQKQNIAPARAAQSSKDKHRMDEDSLDAVYAALIEEPVRSMGEQNSGEPSTTCTSTSESSPDDSHDRKNNLSRLTWKELDRQVLRLYKKGRALIEAMPKE